MGNPSEKGKAIDKIKAVPTIATPNTTRETTA
jgi:hypothetical protein